MSTSQATSFDSLRRREPYYFDCVVFQVEDALFNLPKSHFTRSPIFATIFTLPPGDKDVEGTNDRPFVLQGIKEDEFVNLLKVMYPLPCTVPKLTRQEWISVLKLSTMWEFIDIREGAIEVLSKGEMEPVEKIVCGSNFEVKKWLLDGYIGLLRRAETIADEEAERLGWKTAARLLRLREQISKYRTPAAGEDCTACEGTVSKFDASGLSRCRFCLGYGHGVAGVTPALPPFEELFADAVQKEFQTEL